MWMASALDGVGVNGRVRAPDTVHDDMGEGSFQAQRDPPDTAGSYSDAWARFGECDGSRCVPARAPV